MGQCYITRRGTKTGGATEQLGIYPTGNDGRPMGNVTVIDNVSILSKYPFISNSTVLSVSLPESLRGLADYCFQGCINLQNISIPDKVNSIPQYCFNGCTSLSKVVLPKNLATIKAYAFQKCTGLYDIIIPDEITSLQVSSYAFSECSGLDNDTVTKIASLCNGSIYTYAFANITNITEVTASYTNNYYFFGCTKLKKATILHHLSSGGFGQYVFNNCKNLETVTLPDDATLIDNYMFSGLSNLKNVNIPTSLIKIGDNAFYQTSIDNISLPEALTTISKNAFTETKLTKINIPGNVTVIDYNSFYNCQNLTQVEVSPDAKYSIGQYAFQSTNVDNESVMAILKGAISADTYIFDKCTNITDIEVSFLRGNMFSNCTNLRTVKMIEGTIMTATGDKVFYNDAALEEVILGNGITLIGTNVFYNCTSLKSVYLPSTLTSSYNNSLTSTSSSYYAFYNCTALEDVQLGEDWNLSIRLNASDNITVESMIAMFNSLKDLTGENAKTLTLGATNLAKLTDEQKLIATNKNWTLA